MRWMGTLFFENGKAGWSENYPIDSASSSSAATSLSNIAVIRIQMLMPDCFLVGSRLSDTDIKGDSWETGVALGPGTYALSGDTYWLTTVLLIKQHSAAGQHSSRYVRGLPDDCVSVERTFAPTSTFATALNSYTGLLISQCSIASLKSVPPGQKYNFISIHNASAGGLTDRDIGRPFDLFHGRRLVA